MPLNRLAIYDALFERLNGIPGIVTLERPPRGWDEVSPNEMPYIGLLSNDQSVEAQRGLPSIVTLRFQLYLYVHESSPEGPVRKLFEALDAVAACLERQPNEQRTSNRFNDASPHTTTLGGLVHSCTIDGSVDIAEGRKDPIGLAIIPIVITTLT